MTTGLVLGKFAPLHRGHQHVIETALDECDEVIVLIYNCPETTHVPLPVRSVWLRDLYPAVEVVESWDGPTVVGDSAEITAMHDAYLCGLFASRRIDRFYSSEFYGEHVSNALGAVDRRVDPERERFPVSGTAIRGDLFAHREWMAPRVYRDHVLNVVFLGAPSTGKTTLAEALARRFDTVWMPEYGREYWNEHQVDRRLTLQQLLEIAEGHLEREESLLQQAKRVLLTDTNAITTYMFSLSYQGTAHPKLAALADAAARRYDLCFVCDVDMPYDDAWDRSGAVHREIFQKQILSDLARRKIPYFLVRGNLEDRIEFVAKVVNRFEKFGNPLELNVNPD